MELAGFVHEHLRFTPKHAANLTPREALDEMAGDCSEHADLFASLCRAKGIPTRHCQGLIFRPGRAIYHTWVEAWLGVWIPVDTTVNRIGLPACYLLTTRGSGEGVSGDELPWAMRQVGAAARLLSARRGSHSLIPGNQNSYIVQDGSRLDNLLWGFSVEKPRGWKGVIKGDAVEMLSPDQSATLKCEAAPGDFTADEAYLDLVFNNLKRSLPGFRKVKGDVGEFAKAPAVLVEFVCDVNGRVMRCRQILVSRRKRCYRISCWAPNDRFSAYEGGFNESLKSVRF